LLPKKNLALEPADPRDHSKLFIYDTKKDSISFDYFYNLDKYLPSNSFLVLNNTKVLPARVTMKKSTGGKVVALFLVNEIKDNIVPVIVDRKITVGEKIYFDKNNFLVIIDQKENIFDLKFDFGRETLFSLLKKYGTMPIPPYLKKTSLSRSDLIKKYQTIFAKREGSAAAPTASLHFTDRIFKKIGEKGIKKYFVTLHVGLGTFGPISEENVKEKKLHEEYFEVDEKTLRYIDTSKQEGKKLVAVGTTVTRTLESISNIKDKTFGKTDLFIFPPYDFKMVDILLTNFHLPKSSLMMLVEAFLQHKKAKKSLVELYNMAIKNDFRFYSFGDAMLIL
jgi:S-adenosylmethionine:tRNA ribosyltransferase-isomerase